MPYVPSDKIHLPEYYAGYNRDPEWQRLPTNKEKLSTNKHKRMRQWYSAQNLKPRAKRRNSQGEAAVRREAAAVKARAAGALLAVLRICEDWIVFDLRGLLRNVHWRNLPRESITTRGLLKLFTGDPVIDPTRGVVTFIYDKEVLGIHSLRTIKGKRSKEVLESLTAPQEGEQPSNVGAVSIDLGQTNLVAAAVWHVGRNPEQGLLKTHLARLGLSKPLLDEVIAYRCRHDALEARLRNEALSSLTEVQREEIRAVRSFSSEAARQNVCAKLGIDSNALPWDRMGSYTHFISDHFLNNGGDPALVNITYELKNKKGKKGKEVTRKRDDYAWSLDRPRLSQETHKVLGEALWKLKRESQDYSKLARSKEEFARRCANYVVRETHRITQCSKVVVVIEDLTVNFFHGRGNRQVGWVHLDNVLSPVGSQF